MNRTQALTKIAKLLGVKLDAIGYREYPKAPLREEREVLRGVWRAAKDVHTAATEARDSRRAEILARDDVYQRLKREAVAAEKAAEVARGSIYHHRVEVSRLKGIFNEGVADADNWAEAVEIVERNAQRSA